LKKNIIEVNLDKIDTQIFLEELEIQYKIFNSISISLQEAMKNFSGKFAFLLYEKEKQNFYAVRGESADLYYYPIVIKNEILGYVINTEKYSLERVLVMASNFLAVEKINLEIDFEKILPLEKESIFYLGKTEFSKIDSIKENKIIKWNSTRRWGNCNRVLFGKSDDVWDNNENLNYVISFMSKYIISLDEIDELFLAYFNKSILSANEKDLDDFVDFLVELEKKIKGEKIEEKIKIKENYKHSFLDRYKEIEFPYFMESLERLKEVCLYFF